VPALTASRSAAARRAVTTAPTPFHHASHTQLLRSVRAGDVRPGRVEAVIVPAARPVDCLRGAMRLASELDAPIVALCTGSASATQAVALGRNSGAHTVAIDVHGADNLVPAFRTTALLAGTEFWSTTDVSLRRNLGLLIAKVAGWSRILFLDDDISRLDPADAQAAATLLDDHAAVGLQNIGFPDNSVVCHAYREVGEQQDEFIGGGALAVDPCRTTSFFPRIYNEDWLFLLGDEGPGRLAVTGEMHQRAFSPYADPGRARREEFGDCIGEGLYWLLDSGLGVDAADVAFWRDFLLRRRRLLVHVLHRARSLPAGGERDRLIAAVEAAHAAGFSITPKLCLDYVSAWRADLKVWRDHTAGLTTRPAIEDCMTQLGLDDRWYRAESPALAGAE
jgi:hypothetical protein